MAAPVWHFVDGVPQIGPLTIGPNAVTSTVPVVTPAVNTSGATNLLLQVGGNSQYFISGTTGMLLPTDDNLHDLGTTATANRFRTGYFGTSVNHGALTFATLPTGVAGAVAYITDSNTAVWGATAASGGANKVLVWYNGTNWTVAGK
jgi:hypothetical protein